MVALAAVPSVVRASSGASLSVEPIDVPDGEDGRGRTRKADAPHALVLKSDAGWPARALDPVLHIGDLHFHDYVHVDRTTLRFVVPIEREIHLVSRLRERLSGVACPQHIFEVRQTTGKLLVPTDHWNVQLDTVRDFVGNEHALTSSTSEVGHQVEALQHGPLIQLD